jgi:hypothetical protein
VAVNDSSVPAATGAPTGATRRDAGGPQTVPGDASEAGANEAAADEAATDEAAGDDGAHDAAASAVLTPAACSNACFVNAAAVATPWSLAQVAGVWLQCRGILDLAGQDRGGFPADTVGIEFDPASATAYMLVPDGSGGAVRGPGPAYVWAVAINQPGSSSSGPLFNFSNAWTDSLIMYAIAGATADAACVTSLHMTSDTSGLSPNEADLVFSGLQAPAPGGKKQERTAPLVDVGETMPGASDKEPDVGHAQRLQQADSLARGPAT